MSTQTNGTPFQQWQNFAPPYAFDPAVTIAESTSQIVGALNNTAQNATAERFGISKDIAQSTLGLRDAVEKGNIGISTALERTAGQNQSATERVGNQLGTAVERVGGGAMATTERTGGNILAAVERVAGENRLTTTVSDAASRQASADSARDLSIAIERNGANSISATQQINTSLLGSIERNAGENRVQTLLGSASTDAKLADVRHSILNDVHRVGSNAATDAVQSLNVLTKHITDSAWETRQNMNDMYIRSATEMAKGNAATQLALSQNYASNLLENQKMGSLLSSQSSNQYASVLLEQQKMKEILGSKQDNQFAISQLEQQKLGAALSAQMAEAKYDALKNTTFLADKMSECCCEVKEKVDNLDRDRLRDNLNTANNDNNFLRVLEHTRSHGGHGGYGGYGGYGGILGNGHGPYGHGIGPYGFHHHLHSGRSRSRSRSRSRG